MKDRIENSSVPVRVNYVSRFLFKNLLYYLSLNSVNFELYCTYPNIIHGSDRFQSRFSANWFVRFGYYRFKSRFVRIARLGDLRINDVIVFCRRWRRPFTGQSKWLSDGCVRRRVQKEERTHSHRPTAGGAVLGVRRSRLRIPL